MAASKIERSREVYDEVKGDKKAFVAAMMEEGMTKTGASCYFANCMGEELGRLRHQNIHLIGRSNGNQPSSEEPESRTIVVVMTMELQEGEDVYETAKLAVELLQMDMGNQVQLVSAGEKY